MKRRTWMACLGLLVAVSVGSAQTPAKPVALVGDVPISRAELEAVLKLSDPVPVHLSERQRMQNQMRALSMLIDGVLMRKFLEAKTQPVPAAEVQRRLDEMEVGLRKQDKSLEEFCEETSKTKEQLKADIADNLRWSAYLVTELPDAKVEQFFNDNKDFFEGVTVRASHIVLRIAAGATQVEKDKARETLEGVRKQLQADPKTDFAELAKRYSQDPQAVNGGDLGWIPRKWFDEQFSRVAFALPKDQVSDIVQTDFGLHLIKVTDRKPGKASVYAKMREPVREVCAEDLRQTILTQLRKATKVEINLP